MRLPTNNPVTLPFASTEAPYSAASPHKGVDFSYLPDRTIYAPFSGHVTLVPNNGNDGNGVYMTDSAGRFHGLLHTSKYLVANGSAVTEGQAIAIMGDTGLAQGVHLHYAVKVNGNFIDPLTLVEGEEDMAEVDKWKAVAQSRLDSLVNIAKEVSVNYRDANDDTQVINNIKTVYNRVTELSGMVTTSSSPQDAADAAKFRAIKEALK